MGGRKSETKRCVQLTDTGLKRLHEARRRYRKTIENIVWDENTPSVNTVKKALRQGPVFVDTLERIWDYLRGCAEAQKETLSDLLLGEDYTFVAEQTRANAKNDKNTAGDEHNRWGWVSRQAPRPNRLFVGRRDALDHLHAALQAGSAALIPDAQALIGLGGIGKTQTATAYLYAHRNDYNGVFWVHAETTETLDAGLASLAEELELLSSASATKRLALQVMHDWFQNHSEWLLVLDNADDLPALSPHFPRHHAGHLLLTTRARNTLQWAASIEIVRFTRQEGALLLLRRAGLLTVNETLAAVPPAVRQAAQELSRELGGLPLALEQAGGYIAETLLSVPEYLDRYRRQGLALLDRHPTPDHHTVAMTFQMALEQIGRQSLHGPSAVDLVCLCAFLDPDAIPEVIFTATIANPASSIQTELPVSSQATGVDITLEVIATACRFSLVRRDAISHTLTIHRLVQKVIRDTLNVEERCLWIGRVVQAVATATPDFEFDDWPICDLLLPHWRICADYIKTYRIETGEAAYLVYQAGRYLRVRALYAEAEPVLQLAVGLAEKAHGARHSLTAFYLDTLACLYRDLDRYAESEALHTRSLEIGVEADGPEHTDTAGKLHHLALLYREQEAYNRSEACFLRVIAIREKKPEETGLLAAALTQLAGVYVCQERYDRAEPPSRRALALYENAPNPSPIDIASACNNLALLCVNLRCYAEAELLCLRALKLNEETRGPEHPETGTVHWNLARTLWKQGRAPEADISFRRALEIYERHFPAEHSRRRRLSDQYADFQHHAAILKEA